MPVDWFPRETHPLLVELCGLIVLSRTVGRELAAIPRDQLADTAVLARFSALVRTQVRLSGAIASLSTKMRLTHQSRYGKRTAARLEQTTRSKPWDLGQEPPQLDQGPDEGRSDDGWN
jgi:hypothetical protein